MAYPQRRSVEGRHLVCGAVERGIRAEHADRLIEAIVQQRLGDIGQSGC
jgi:hypothetical protein